MNGATALTEADLRQITGVPFMMVHAHELPRPIFWNVEPNGNDVTANARALKGMVEARVRKDISLAPLLKFDLSEFKDMMDDQTTPPVCRWLVNADRDTIYPHGPHTQLDGPMRMAGLFRPRAALLLDYTHEDPRMLMAQQLQCPPELVESSWPVYKGEFENLVRLHEAGHAAQGYTPIDGLYRNNTEQAFWYELDADYSAISNGRKIGISAAARQLMIDARSVMAFNSPAKRYWFTPQINGIEASFADTIAAHREIRAMTMIALDNRYIPATSLLKRWAEGHDGERMTCKNGDVLNLHRSFNRLAEKLEARPHIFSEDLQALAHLNRHHEFVLPLAQQIAALTVKAASRFMPTLIGA